MSDNFNQNDSLTGNEFEKIPLPTGLNVLTILTIIGCVLGLIASIVGFMTSKGTYEKRAQVIEQMQSAEMPKFAKKMMGNPAEYEQMVVKSYENRIPILLIGLVAVALCFIGAIQMRKRQKQGYLLYVIGEFLPLVTMLFFIGFFTVSGFTFIFSAVIAIVFVLLYTMQKKHLIN